MSKAIKANKSKQNASKSGSNAPLIIGGVLLAAILGGWWMYTSSQSVPASNSTANTAATPIAARTPPVPVNAPPGAQPPNQSGSQTALVTLEEFADFQCGSCAAANPILNEIKSTYGSRIRFIFRNFPLSIPAHDKAFDAAVAAEASGMQGKFWEMQNLLFTNQKGWTDAGTYRDMWKGYAQKIGLDVAKWENDMAGMAAKSRVNADLERGRAMNVNSTPSLFINNTPVSFAEMKVETLKDLIDAQLKQAASSAERQKSLTKPEVVAE